MFGNLSDMFSWKWVELQLCTVCAYCDNSHISCRVTVCLIKPEISPLDNRRLLVEQGVGKKFNARCVVHSFTFTEAIYRATEGNVLRDGRITVRCNTWITTVKYIYPLFYALVSGRKPEGPKSEK